MRRSGATQMRAGAAAALIALATLCPAPGRALTLDLPPNAAMTRQDESPDRAFAMPIGPWKDGTLPVLHLSGHVVQQAWRLTAEGRTPLQILAPLRAALTDAGYRIVFACSSAECGGFDFRFNTPILAAPDMFVDLFDFRYLVARRWPEETGGDKGNGGGTGGDHVSLIASRAGNTSYLQITRVSDPKGSDPLSVSARGTAPAGPAKASKANADAPAAQADTAQADAPPLVQALMQQGHAVLRDLEFDSGAATLGEGPYTSLETLAQWLKADPARRVALVGHTDMVGALDPNITLSQQRAQAVVTRLMQAYDVPQAQIESEGIGFLSPIASNQTKAGRDANRRVEAVVLKLN